MAFIKGVFTSNLEEQINSSKVLVVGAGGIGCEILKNLVLSGFKQIEIIDLDTIDVSNLNRQFLFHKEHVGKSKAEVARESALAFNPNVEIVAHHDSITSNRFGVGYFQQFSLVLNALDNRAARNHVNRMCLTSSVPLIESGTAGYNGQVELIKKGLTQCYECTPKAAQKSFPGCTIRNTPSEPIHCIVWAKHLFNQLFGEDNADEDVSPDTADPEAGATAGAEALSAEANDQGNVTRQSTRAWAQSCDYDAEKIYNKLFGDDIEYLLSMSSLWRTRTPPTPMRYADTLATSSSATAANNSNENNNAGTQRDQKVWSLGECAAVLRSSISGLRDQLQALSSGDHLVWDKDDRHGMDFVAACANIRAHVFHIPQKSRFEIKSMAGNIIPAIATTNAITAGMVVLHAFKVLRGEFEQCPNVYMRLRPNARNQIITADKALNAPNPKCYVCSAKPEVTLRVATDRLTIKELRDEVLIKAMNMLDPDVLIDGTGTIVLSSEEGETEGNLGKTLAEMAIVDGAVLKVDDFHQNYELTVIVVHKAAEYDQSLFEVVADPSQLVPEGEREKKGGSDGKEKEGEKEKEVEKEKEKEEEEVVASSSKRQKVERVEVEESDDDCCIVGEDEEVENVSEEGRKEAGDEEASKSATKRKSMEPSAGPASKKSKGVLEATASSSTGLVALEEDDDDVICIDD